MKTPVWDALLEYKKTRPVRFHMPGHKGRPLEQWETLTSFYPFDVTELSSTDNLYCPQDFLQQAQARAAACYYAKSSSFLVNGSTCGVESMLLSCLKEGDRVLVDRNCHQSVLFGLILCGAEPVYLYPDMAEEFCVTSGISIGELEKKLKENPGCKAVIITSPNYHGIVQNIAKIAEITHAYGALLLVDEAHGAHFPFSPVLPETALKQGADMSVVSLHKTLPCPNQCALLNSAFHAPLEAIRLCQTSSPSFPLMACMDAALADYELHGKTYYERLAKLLLPLYQLPLKRLKLLQQSNLLQGQAIDFTRITISFRDALINGLQADQLLKKNYHIYCEMATKQDITFICTPADTQEDISILCDALLDLEKLEGENKKKEETELPGFFSGREFKNGNVQGCLPRTAYFAQKETIAVEAAAGRICACHVVETPPCVPIITYGEYITSELCAYLLKNGIQQRIDVVK